MRTSAARLTLSSWAVERFALVTQAAKVDLQGFDGSARNRLAPFLQEVPALGDLDRRRAVADVGVQAAHNRRAEHGILHADRHQAAAGPAIAPERARLARQS